MRKGKSGCARRAARAQRNLLMANAADEETQSARLAAVRGKKVLFITCFLADYLYQRDNVHFKQVVALGAKLYYVFGLTDEDKRTAQKFTDDGLVSGGVLWADLADEKNAGSNIVAAALESGIKFDSVFCPYEHAMTLLGEVAEKLGLYGNPTQAYINARDKQLSRHVCTQAGVAAPRFAQVTSQSELEEAVQYVGLPLVLKPNSGASSDGVYRCNTMEEVCERFQKVNSELKTHSLFKWSPGCQVCVLLEEYIDGDEFDVDVLMWDGQAVYANAIDNNSCPEPYFMETGSVCPTIYQGKKKQQLLDYAVQCVKTLGFISGLFHVELRYSMKRTTVDENGEVLGQPLLIEVNARMGGGRTHLFHKEVYGVDIFLNLFLASIGIPINPPRAETPLCAMGDYELCAEKTGVLLHNRFLDHLTKHPNVDAIKVHLQPGAKVRGVDSGIPQWLGYFIVKGNDSREVYEIIEQLTRTIDVPIIPEEAEKGIDATANPRAKMVKAC